MLFMATVCLDLSSVVCVAAVTLAICMCIDVHTCYVMMYVYTCMHTIYSFMCWLCFAFV